MTAPMRPLEAHALAPDPERLLDAYAEATRVTASSAMVRRFQAGIAQERAGRRTPGGVVRSLSARWPAVRAGTTLALRVQGLALLLLMVLALGLVAGGAGAAIVSLLDGPTRGSRTPTERRVVAPSPAPVPSVAPRPLPTPRARPLAQHAEVRHRAADRATRRERLHRTRAGAEERPVITVVCRAAEPDAGAVRPHAGHVSCAF